MKFQIKTLFIGTYRLSCFKLLEFCYENLGDSLSIRKSRGKYFFEELKQDTNMKH